MADIRVDESLWAARMAPEGILERWHVTDGETVTLGDCVAEVRIEDALHEIATPASGRLSIFAPKNAIIEPGSVLGKVCG